MIQIDLKDSNDYRKSKRIKIYNFNSIKSKQIKICNFNSITGYLFSRSHKPQGNFSCSVSSCNYISSSSGNGTFLKHMSMSDHSNKPINMTTQITAIRQDSRRVYLSIINATTKLPKCISLAYILTISPSSNTVSSLESGEK